MYFGAYLYFKGHAKYSLSAVVIAGVALDGAESYNYIGYTVFKA